VQHWAVRLSRTIKQELTPVWDAEARTWVISIEEDIACDDFLHSLMSDESGDSYSTCQAGKHHSTVLLRFRRGGFRQGLRPWKLRTTVNVDGIMSFPIDPNVIMSLLAKPTDPQGDGKARTEASGSNRQQMRVKRTTVIRV
jgi:hypothetical protein